MKKWHLAPGYNYSQDLPYSRIILQLLYNRGLHTEEEVRDFFEPENSNHDPFLFRDMGMVVGVLISRIKAREKLAIFGDYDADGVTSSSIMAECLRALGAQVEIYIPDRVKEGYGLNGPALERLAASGVKLVITVDNGIRNKTEVEYGQSLGLDMIVTDHHVLPEDRGDLPPCPIINPADPEDGYPWKKLCGAGVAYKVAQALVSRSTLSQEKKKAILDGLLDLAAIGTIGDLVPLLGENRLFAQRGLRMINSRPRLGLRELITQARIGNGQPLEAWNISWQIVPRLNAASRMEHADTAVSLILSRDAAEARELARDLNEKNAKRQAMAEDIFCQADSLIDDKQANILIAVSPPDVIWNEGLIGLAAGKLSERYYRPALVIARTEEGGFKSSGRSIEEFNLIEAISGCSVYLSKYGGHPMACGFSLEGENNLEAFIAAIREKANRSLTGQDISPKLEIDGEISLDEIDEALVKSIATLEPFGQDNPKPVFMSSRLRVVDRVALGNGGQHLKLRVCSASGKVFSALAFSAPENFMAVSIGDTLDLAYNLDVNRFNGRTEIQLKIVDIRVNV